MKVFSMIVSRWRRIIMPVATPNKQYNIESEPPVLQGFSRNENLVKMLF